MARGRRAGWIAAGTGLALLAGSVTATATFPGRNGAITFNSGSANGGDIYATDPGGGPPIRLTTEPLLEKNPTWSPDGTRIAYLRAVQGGSAPDLWDVWILTPGGGQSLLAQDADTGPSWSRDGQQVVFSRRTGTSSRLFRVGVNGSPAQAITPDGGNHEFPEVSPASDVVAYSAGADAPLTLVPLNGATAPDPLDLPAAASGFEEHVSWAPSGTALAFTTGQGASTAVATRTVNVGAGTAGAVSTLTNEPGFDGWPVWSPDGTKIAFESARIGNLRQVYAMDPVPGAGATAVTTATSVPAGANRPDWQALPPVPVLSGLSVTVVGQGRGDLTMDVFGANFPVSAVVRVDGQARTTRRTSAGQLSVDLPASDFATPGVRSVTVGSAVFGLEVAGPLGLTVNAAPGTVVGTPELLPGLASKPAVGGRAILGARVVCNPGSWTGTPAPTFTFSWLRGAKVIPSARGSRYLLRNADVGRRISCRVTATNSAGVTRASSARRLVNLRPLGRPLVIDRQFRLILPATKASVFRLAVVAPAKARIQASCISGCSVRAVRVLTRTRRVDFTAEFQGIEFGVGAGVQVRITRPGHVGRLARFTVTRRGGINAVSYDIGIGGRLSPIT